MSQWVQSGQLDQVVFFNAPPGLGTWVVNGAKGDAAAAAFTTPTVTELGVGTMPGCYKLLLDEQTTITAGKATEMLKLYISAGGWAGVSVEVTLFDNLPSDLQKIAGSDDFQVAGVGGQGYGPAT